MPNSEETQSAESIGEEVEMGEVEMGDVKLGEKND